MLRDKVVALGEQKRISAAVVFLPENTLHYGQHSSDKCFCKEMYGELKPWGCKVSERWRSKASWHYSTLTCATLTLHEKDALGL